MVKQSILATQAITQGSKGLKTCSHLVAILLVVLSLGHLSWLVPFLVTLC